MNEEEIKGKQIIELERRNPESAIDYWKRKYEDTFLELIQEKEKNKKLEEEKKQAFKDYNSTAGELMDVINLMAEKLRDLKDDIDTLHEGEIDCFIPKDFCDINGCAKYKDCADCIKAYYFNKVKEKANDN